VDRSHGGRVVAEDGLVESAALGVDDLIQGVAEVCIAFGDEILVRLWGGTGPKEVDEVSGNRVSVDDCFHFVFSFFVLFFGCFLGGF
jgi:hypothetical protein